MSVQVTVHIQDRERPKFSRELHHVILRTTDDDAVLLDEVTYIALHLARNIMKEWRLHYGLDRSHARTDPLA